MKETKMIFIGPAGTILKTSTPNSFFLITKTGKTIGPFSGEDVKVIYNYLLSPDHSVNSDGLVFDNRTGEIVFNPKGDQE